MEDYLKNLKKEIKEQGQIKVYGERLLAKVRELKPDTPVIGHYSVNYNTGDVLHGCPFVEYIIREGKSKLARFNPFARDILRIDSDGLAYALGMPIEVTLFDHSLTEGIDALVGKLDKKSGLSFKLSEAVKESFWSVAFDIL